MMDSTVKQTLDKKRRLLNLLTVSLPPNSTKRVFIPTMTSLNKEKSALRFLSVAYISRHGTVSESLYTSG